MNAPGGGPADRKTPEELLSLARKLEGRQFQSWMPPAARPDAVQEACLAGWQACNRCRLDRCMKDRCGYVRTRMQGAMLAFWQNEDFLSRSHRWEVTHGIAADCRSVSLESLESLAGDSFLPVPEPYAEGEMVMVVEEERMKYFSATEPEKIEQIQKLWAQGMPTMEIAEQLGVSTTTVRKYRHARVENSTDRQADPVPSNGQVSPPREEERMKNFDPIDPQKVVEIQRLWAEGVPTMEIVERVGVASCTVRKYRHLGENKIAKIRELADQGLSSAAIAQELGVGETTVRKYKRSNGEAANGNGHASHVGQGTVSNHSADLDQVEQLLADRWQRLSLIERLQFFLGRD